MKSSDKPQKNETKVKREAQDNGEMGSYTLFSVTHETRESRSERIRALFREQPVFGYLLAVFDFEWTIRRAVVMMSGCPASVIKERFESKKYTGWSAYQGCWTKCVQKTLGDNIPDLACVAYGVPSEDVLGTEDKKKIQAAMNLRNKLVHGLSGTLPRDKADAGFELLLSATERIVAFVEGRCGRSMFERLYNPRARCKRCLRQKRCKFPEERAKAKELAAEKRAGKAGGKRAAR